MLVANAVASGGVVLSRPSDFWQLVTHLSYAEDRKGQGEGARRQPMMTTTTPTTTTGNEPHTLTFRLLLGHNPNPSDEDPPRKSCPLCHRSPGGNMPKGSLPPKLSKETGSGTTRGVLEEPLPTNAGLPGAGFCSCLRLRLVAPVEETVLGRGATVNSPESSQASGGENGGKLEPVLGARVGVVSPPPPLPLAPPFRFWLGRDV